MARHLTIFSLILALMSLALLSGCGGSGGSTVADLGSEEITVDQFVEFVARSNLGFRSADEEFAVKRQMLDSLINHRLLVQGAYERGLDEDDGVQRLVKSKRPNFLLDALYQVHVADRATVSP